MTEEKAQQIENTLNFLANLDDAERTYIVTLALFHGSTHEIAGYINRVTCLLAGLTAIGHNKSNELIYKEVEKVIKDINEDTFTTLGHDSTRELILKFAKTVKLVKKPNAKETH